MTNEFHDVDFEEIKDGQKTIRGKALYFSTAQVAEVLGIPDSKLRYYTNVFDDILKIEYSNKSRRYTQDDINKLKFIVELKDEGGMTIKQIQEYLQEVDFDPEQGIQIKQTNPLSVQAIAKALLEEQRKQMEGFKGQVLEVLAEKLNQQTENIRNNNEMLKDRILEEVSMTVDTIIDNKLDDVIDNQEQLKEIINTTIAKEIKDSIEAPMSELVEQITSEELKATERIDKLINVLDERHKQYEQQQEQEKSRGFLSRIFGK